METIFVIPLLKASFDSLALTAAKRRVREHLHLKARGVTLDSLRKKINTQGKTSRKDKTVLRKKVA